MSGERPAELCVNCHSETGNAGAGDGSLFDALSQGPYCQQCYDALVGDVERQFSDLEAEAKRYYLADGTYEECESAEACVVKRMAAAKLIAELAEGPGDDEQRIHQTGGYPTGLHCGVEDRDLQGDAYGAADYGFSEGVDAVLEWMNGVVATPEAAVKKPADANAV